MKSRRHSAGSVGGFSALSAFSYRLFIVSTWGSFPRKGKDTIRYPFRLYKKLRRIFRGSGKQNLNHFWPRRVRGQKYLSGCKCASCAPKAHKECAQQTAKNWRKSPKGFFDTLKGYHPVSFQTVEEVQRKLGFFHFV